MRTKCGTTERKAKHCADCAAVFLRTCLYWMWSWPHVSAHMTN